MVCQVKGPSEVKKALAGYEATSISASFIGWNFWGIGSGSSWTAFRCQLPGWDEEFSGAGGLIRTSVSKISHADSGHRDLAGGLPQSLDPESESGPCTRMCYVKSGCIGVCRLWICWPPISTGRCQVARSKGSPSGCDGRSGGVGEPLSTPLCPFLFSSATQNRY